jgi:hypothetical protein
MSKWGTWENTPVSDGKMFKDDWIKKGHHEGRHTVFSTGEWGVLYAVCADCGKTVKLEMEHYLSGGAEYMKDIQLLMDRHCKTPNAHVEKIVRQGFIGGTTTPYIYELKR